MKKDSPSNPFLIAGYNGPASFCDREAETVALIDALSNGRNVTLISPRRMGKTGLLHHAFHTLTKADKECRCFYMDIFPTRNLAEFVALFGKTVLGKLDGFSETAVRKLAGFFKSFRPHFSIDPQTGSPEMTLDIRAGDAVPSLTEIFEYIRKSKMQCRIAIDEFQQILEYPDKGVEALLRSHTQRAHTVGFVFAGSEQHVMDAMFSSAKRPFYQSTQKMALREIPIESYREFARMHFAAAGRKLPATVFDRIYAMASGHTWYVQLVLNILYARRTPSCTDADVDSVLHDILREESATYKTYCGMLPAGQLRVLRAVAAERNAVSPTGSAFIRRHALGATSSVKLALNALCDKALVLKDDNGHYSVYDRFFGLWLAR